MPRKRRQNGGEVQPFPSQYYGLNRSSSFNLGQIGQAGQAGQDLVKTSGEMVRNFLPRFSTQGGRSRSRSRSRSRRNKTRRGGFVPSVMEPFSAATSKYVAPVALFAAYKFMTSRKKKTRRNH